MGRSNAGQPCGLVGLRPLAAAQVTDLAFQPRHRAVDIADQGIGTDHLGCGPHVVRKLLPLLDDLREKPARLHSNKRQVVSQGPRSKRCKPAMPGLELSTISAHEKAC